VFTNNPKAGVIERAKQFQLEVQVFNKKDFTEGLFAKKVVKIKPRANHFSRIFMENR